MRNIGDPRNYVPLVPENLFETWLLNLSLQQPAAEMYEFVLYEDITNQKKGTEKK